MPDRTNEIVCVGFDAAPTRAFLSLKKELEGLGFVPQLYVAGGRSYGSSLEDLRQTLTKAVKTADLVLIGMSSSATVAEMELYAAGEARRQGKPLLVYGDIDRAWYRVDAIGMSRELREYVSGYLGISALDAEEARTVFPNATPFGTGNPDREAQYFAMAQYDRSLVRAELGINQADKLVLVSGRKKLNENLEMWRMTRDALQELSDTMRHKVPLHLVISLHPGDQTPRSDYDAFLVEDTSVNVSLLSADVMSTDKAMVGADVVVEFLSTSGVVAAMHGVPIVTLMLPLLLSFLAAVDGSSEPEIVRHQASTPVSDVSELRHVLGETFIQDRLWAGETKSSSRGTLPIPGFQGQALEKMIDAIFSVL